MKGYTFMFLSVLCIAAMGSIVNLIENISVFTIAFYRLLFGAIALAVIMPFLDRNFLKVSKKDLLNFTLIGFILAINIPIYFAAFIFAPVSNVLILETLYPLFVILFASIFLREKTTRNELIALLIAVIAMLMLNPLSSGYALGNLLAVANAVTFAILIVYLRYEDKSHSIGFVFWYILFGMLFLLPVPFLFGFGNLSGNLHWLLMLGLFSTAFYFIFLNYALEHLRADVASLIGITLYPFLGILIALLVLGQFPTVKMAIGGAMLILGASLVVRETSKHHHILRKP